jgi:hypothetical protein
MPQQRQTPQQPSEDTATHAVQHATIALDGLIPHPRNYRRHPESQVARLEASLARFGQVRSIVVQEGADGRFLIVAGHGLVTAARAHGLTALRADVIPAHWTAQQVEGYLIADNESSRGADDDLVALAAMLEEQQHAGEALETLGYSDEELAALLEQLAEEALTGDGAPDDAGELEEADEPQRFLVFAPEQVAAAAFTHFRGAGFPYRALPAYISMQQINRLAAMDDDTLLRTDAGYHVADTYHPHRFLASAESMKSPVEAFRDDALLRRVLALYLDQGGSISQDIIGKLSIVSGTQACSNFRPGFALHLYRRFCQPGAVVLDTSTGYGGRLVGFLASGFAGTYIGIDPNTETHAGNTRMAQELGFADAVELYNLPAEDVSHETVCGRCDFAFTSPPYFAKEHYSDEPTQSWRRYGTGDAWRRGFLQPMLALQFAALKPGAHAVVNIADVKLRNHLYPLERWTVEDGQATGFEYVTTDRFMLTSRIGAGMPDEIASEPVIIFKKPETSHAA